MIIHNNSEQYSFSSKMKKLKISWQDCKYFNSTCHIYSMYGYELPLKMPMSIYYLIAAPDSMSDFRHCKWHCPFSRYEKNQWSLTEIYRRGKNRIAKKYP